MSKKQYKLRYEAEADCDIYDSSNEVDVESDVPKKITIPTFESIKTDQIVEMMNKYIDDVYAWIQLPATTARILLSHTKWDIQELMDRCTDDNCDKFFDAAHVRNPFEERPVKRNTRRKLTCSICYTDFSQEDIVGLACKHEYCKGCWRQYLTIKIVDDGNVESICCPEPKCGIIVDDVTIMELITDDETKQKYKQLMTSSFVQHDNSLRWCPAPGCKYAIKVNHPLEYLQNCKCKCGKELCFNCGDDAHDPIPCALMKNWKTNANDDTIEYLATNTKGCPKCHSAIEKNGGCNHMTCQKCKHEFCWLCFGLWKKHDTDRCNRYEGADSDNHDDQRWEHYFKRYGQHKKSLKMEELSTQKRIEQFPNEWIKSSLMKKAVNTLLESRKQLMFTYIFAYYAKSNNQKAIFEANQADLESATEALSQYFEEEITIENLNEMQQKINDKSIYCILRIKTMQEHIFDGFDNNWWTFATYIRCL